jgi:protein-S-isoprenylcysteine O-methyltransferase Ste14
VFDLSRPGRRRRADRRAVRNAIKAFHLTNPIARASVTMAECAAVVPAPPRSRRSRPVSAFFSNPAVTWTLLTTGGILLVVIWVLLSLAFLLLADRKIWAGVQMRKGPNVVGPFGLLQSFADF